MGHNPNREAKNARISTRSGYLIGVRCCRLRHYRVEDVIEVYGDIRIAEMDRHLVCEDCGGRDWLSARLVYPHASERAQMCVRQLVKVEVIRRPVWREG